MRKGTMRNIPEEKGRDREKKKERAKVRLISFSQRRPPADPLFCN